MGNHFHKNNGALMVDRPSLKVDSFWGAMNLIL